MLLLSVGDAKKPIVFFSSTIKKFNPNLHPKGYRGLFIETPDSKKAKATNLNAGDVLATKSGKAFIVEKQTDKGVKVNPLDMETGEKKPGFTVLGNDVTVAPLELASGPGSVHAISDLTPGQYVQTAKGKRFKIAKHGKWSTVYPVDDKGEISGKHTVLPPGTPVTVTNSVVSDPFDTPEPVIDALVEVVHHDKTELAIKKDAIELKPIVDEIYDFVAGNTPAGLDISKYDFVDGNGIYQLIEDAVHSSISNPLGVPNKEDFQHGVVDFVENEIPNYLDVSGASVHHPKKEQADEIAWMVEVFDVIEDGTNVAFNQFLDTPGLQDPDIEPVVPVGSNADKLATAAAVVQAHHSVEALGGSPAFKEQFPEELPPIPQRYAPGVTAESKIQIVTHPFEGYGKGQTSYTIHRVYPDGSRELLDIGSSVRKSDGKKVAADLAAKHEAIEEVVFYQPRIANPLAFAEDVKSGKYIERVDRAVKQRLEAAKDLPEIPKGMEPADAPIVHMVSTNHNIDRLLYYGQRTESLDSAMKDDSYPYFMYGMPRRSNEGLADDYAYKRTQDERRELLVDRLKQAGISPDDVQFRILEFGNHLDKVPATKDKTRNHVFLVYKGSGESVPGFNVPPRSGSEPHNNGIRFTTDSLPVGKQEHGQAASNLAFWNKHWGPEAAAEIQATIYGADYDQDVGVRRAVQSRRAGKPERFVPELASDFDLADLKTRTATDANKVLQRLGYREIQRTPKPKNLRSYVNALNTRVDVHIDKKMVRDVDVERAIGFDTKYQSAPEYHGMLDDLLKSGGDLDSLDPSLQNLGANQDLVKKTLFLLAKGKKNNVAEKIGKQAPKDDDPKVVSDVEYVQRLLNTDQEKWDLERFVSRPDEMEFSIPLTDANSSEGIPNDPDSASGGNVLVRPSHLGVSLSVADDPLAVDSIQEQILVERLAAMRVVAHLPIFNAIARHPDLPAMVDPVAVEGLKTHPDQDNVEFWTRWANELKNLRERKPSALDTVIAAQAAKSDQTYDDVSMKTRDSLKDFKLVVQQQFDATNSLRARPAVWRERRFQAMSPEIQAMRDKEGTVKNHTVQSMFDLPVWDEVEFEPQTFDQIQERVAEVRGTSMDVPAFYNGGMVSEGVLHHDHDLTFGEVPPEFNDKVKNTLVSFGAMSEVNRRPIALNIPGRTKLHAGKQLTLHDGPPKIPEIADVEAQAIRTTERIGGSPSDGKSVLKDKIYATTANAKDADDAYRQIMELFDKQLVSSAKVKYRNHFKKQYERLLEPRRIEFVPHDQGDWQTARGAATSQRGRLSLIGYSPKEAATRLQELGFLGDLTDEVPYNVVMQSSRKQGLIPKIHPDYLSGVAEPPTSKASLVHGVTAKREVNGASVLDAILNGGGLLSIKERYRHNVLMGGSSVSGDVRSGIDHVVFAAYNAGSACGSGSDIRFVFTPSALLRENVVLAPRDFGGMDSRYTQYRTYLNDIQQHLGEEKTNLYGPVSPAVRQWHQDSKRLSQNAEFNLTGSVRIEDMAVMGIPPEDIPRVRAKLRRMKEEGLISRYPVVTTAKKANAFSKHSIGPGALMSQYMEALEQLESEEQRAMMAHDE